MNINCILTIKTSIAFDLRFMDFNWVQRNCHLAGVLASKIHVEIWLEMILNQPVSEVRSSVKRITNIHSFRRAQYEQSQLSHYSGTFVAITLFSMNIHSNHTDRQEHLQLSHCQARTFTAITLLGKNIHSYHTANQEHSQQSHCEARTFTSITLLSKNIHSYQPVLHEHAQLSTCLA